MKATQFLIILLLVSTTAFAEEASPEDGTVKADIVHVGTDSQMPSGAPPPVFDSSLVEEEKVEDEEVRKALNLREAERIEYMILQRSSQQR